MSNPRERSDTKKALIPAQPATPEAGRNLDRLVVSFMSRMDTWRQACQTANTFHYTNYSGGIRGTFDVVKTGEGFQPKSPFSSLKDPNYVCTITYKFAHAGSGELDIKGGPLLIDPATGKKIRLLTINRGSTSSSEDETSQAHKLTIRQSSSNGASDTSRSSVIYDIAPGKIVYAANRGGKPSSDQTPDYQPMSDETAERMFDVVDHILLGGSGNSLQPQEQQKQIEPPKPQEE